MPVIRQYSRQFSDSTGPVQQRQRSGEEFGGAVGRGLAQAGAGLQDFGSALKRRDEQQEVSTLNVELSKVQADNAIELQNLMRNANPGDKDIFNEFQKKSQEKLDDIGGKLATRAGRQYFQTASAKMYENLRITTAQTQADLDGEKAVMDYTSTVNNLSASLISDPSSLPLSSEMHSQAIDNLVAQGLLPAAQGAKLKQQGTKDLVKASIRGWARLNPDHAKSKIASGEYDSVLGADTKVQMLGEVEQAIRAKDIESERRLRLQEDQKEQQKLQTQNDFLEKMSQGELSTDDILSSNLQPGS